MWTLASIEDEDFQFWVLVEDLLDSAVVATFLGQLARLLLLIVLGLIIVAEVGRS
jgi:hypothetical protein